MHKPSRREFAARALCRKAGLPEDFVSAGRPAWQSYLDDVDAVIAPLDQIDLSFDFKDAAASYTRRNRLTKRVATGARGVPALIVALKSNDRDGDHIEFDRLVAKGFRLVLREDETV